MFLIRGEASADLHGRIRHVPVHIRRLPAGRTGQERFRIQDSTRGV